MVEELAIAWLPHDWQALKNATVSLCWVNITKCIWTAFRKRYFSRCHPRLCLSALRSVLNLLCKTRSTPEVTFSCFWPLTPDYFWGHRSLWNRSVQHLRTQSSKAHLPFSFFIFSIRCCPFFPSISKSISRRSVTPDLWQKASIVSDRAVGTYKVLKTVSVNLI